MKEVTRLFVIPGKEPMPDPSPFSTVEEVQGMLARTYPSLTNATYTSKIIDGKRHIEFKASVGTKG